MSGSAGTTVQPVVEQQRAVDLFLSGGNLRVDAYASCFPHSVPCYKPGMIELGQYRTFGLIA